MSAPLPLASASQRIRRRPGRPRGPVVSQAPAPPAAPPLTRENARTVAVVWLRQGPKDLPEWVPASARLVGLPIAAAYLGVSTWTIRDWQAQGLLAPVALPATSSGKPFGLGGKGRRLLFDVTDLDRLIEEGKA